VDEPTRILLPTTIPFTEADWRIGRLGTAGATIAIVS
jgi:hypothetical protein